MVKFPKKKYRVILADPAWSYAAYTKARSGTPRRIDGDHYNTMTLDELKALPVTKIADSECALFMWITDTHVEQAFDLAHHWGFRYSSLAFVWRKKTKHGKDHFGMGKTTRKNVELVYLFVKQPPKRNDAGVRQIVDVDWIEAQVREHSRKPDGVHERIERLYSGPYIELFARQRRPNWDCWGNETDKFSPIDVDTDSTESTDDDFSLLLGA